LPFINTAVVLRDKGQAIVTVPGGFNAYDSLEAGLKEGGFSATLLDPVHLTLKVGKSDGVVDLASVANGCASVAGVAAAQPSGDGVAVYADPAVVDLTQLVALAVGQGLQAEVVSHERIEVAVTGVDCKKKEAFVANVLAALPVVLAAGADSTKRIAWVFTEKGAITVDALKKALAEGPFDGSWCPMGHEVCDDKAKAAALEPSTKSEHPTESEPPSGNEHPKAEHPTGSEHPKK